MSLGATTGRGPDGPRRGPRPLALYLARACSAATDEPARLAAFLDGLKAYWVHPYRRSELDRPVIWRAGGARLIDYRPAGGAPVLLIPSLVNRAHVLDLMPGRSLAVALADAGVRPLLLDWGEPDQAERGFDLAAYTEQRLQPALAAARSLSRQPPVLLGYCMGGLLALALATRCRERLGGLGLLATPWDFAAAGSLQPLPTPVARAGLLATLATLGQLPVSTLDWGFGLVDPDRVVAKFAAFGRLDPASDEASGFVAVEDWLADGVPLAGPVARECLDDWYGANLPAKGRWRVGNRLVRPEALRLPSFIALPRADRIVPWASAAPLARLIRGAEVLEPRSGHVGMVAGRDAAKQLWNPLIRWLRRIARDQL